MTWDWTQVSHTIGKHKHPHLHLSVVAIEKWAFWLPSTTVVDLLYISYNTTELEENGWLESFWFLTNHLSNKCNNKRVTT